jgi:integral membrane protein (TIGR01906 family)
MNKCWKILDRIVIIIFPLLLIILSIGISSISFTKSKSFYMNEFKKNDTVSTLTDYYYNPDGEIEERTYTEDDLDTIITSIIDYLMDKTDDMQVIIDDKYVFSNQAIKHMADVKVLYQKGILLCKILFIVFIISSLYFIYRYKKLQGILFKYSVIPYAVVLLVVIILIICMMSNFYNTFVIFHKIIFPDPVQYRDAFFRYTSNYEELSSIQLVLILR